MIKNIARIVISSNILLCALPVNAAPAPVVPDAGQTIRELQQQRELNPPKSTPPLQPEEAAPQQERPPADVRMMVSSFQISGNSVIATAKLEALLADMVGSEHTLADLNDAAARITSYYHERGYILSRAYIPPQEIKDGTVMINVQEGKIGERRVNNQSRLSDKIADGYLDAIKSGDVLQAAPVDRALLLLNDTPGVGAARATLQPGASAGLSDLVVELSPSATYFANIQADNYGNYFTGEYRLGAELAINSPLKIGDLVTMRAMASDQNLRYAYLAYQVPLGSSGLRLGATFSGTRYILENEFVTLRTQGTATIGSLFTVYPFIRSQKTNLSGILTLENKKFTDEYLNASVIAEKQAKVATLGLTFDHQDTLGAGGMTMLNLSLAKGKLSMDETSLVIDEATANTNGPFSRVNYMLNRIQLLNTRSSLFLSLSGQLANKNLNSSEQFSLGGAYGVRAYPQGEAMGDEGNLATIELRNNLSQKLQAVLFYDAGSVIFNREPYLPGANTRFISGGGAGVNAKVFGADFKVYAAVRGSGGIPTAEPYVSDNKTRWWLQLSKYF